MSVDDRADAAPPRIAYFAIKYPTLSQTFIRREVEALCGMGAAIEVHPLWDFRGPGGGVIHRWVLWDYVSAPFRLAWEIWLARRYWVSAGRLLAAHRPSFWEGWFMTLWGTAFALLKRAEFARNPPDVFHGVWATGPATSAAVLGVLLGRPFSFGAHAYDIRRHGGDPLLDAKLAAARFVHTTTAENVTYLRSRLPGARIVLSRRGLPVLPPDPGVRVFRRPVRLLSVGRLVPKKAHSHQLAAVAELVRRGFACELRIAGDGPLRGELESRIAELGLADRVQLLGACEPDVIAEQYAWADLFWHTGVVDAAGDRDGLPNVIPEAMAHRLPVISCPEPGATEAVQHGVTGWVVETGNAMLLADAVETLAGDGDLAARLGEQAREWVAANFLSEPNARILLGEFRRAREARR